MNSESSPPRPDVSVCIVSWNAREYLRRCLASLYHPHHPDVLAAWERAGRPVEEFTRERVSWEVVVVDQESLDGSAGMAEREFPDAKVVRQRPNLGFAGGNNVAFRHARGRYLLLLNSDTVVRPGWMTELVEYGDAHPRAGLIGPRLLNPNGSLQYSCRRFPSLGAGVFRNTPFEWLAPKNRFVQDYLMEDWDHAEAREVDWLSGACVMARRDMVEEIGGLDERYFMYFEDVEWSRRAHDRGWEVHYVPEPVVIHEVGRSSDRRPKRMIVMHHQSAYRYFSENSAFGRNPLGRPILGACMAARAALTLGRNEVIKWRGRLTSRGTRHPPPAVAKDGQEPA
jgi:GT2 family glycosyltransferase